MNTVSFVGLTTVDVLYRVDEVPGRNRKVVARSQAVYAGGPATNAAIACGFLGSRVVLQSALGRNAAAGIAREELARYGVEHHDLAPEFDGPPTISSILVVAGTGERSVVSANATRLPGGVERLERGVIERSCLLMVDGHNMGACLAAARAARAAGVATVLDGGSWKPGIEELLELIDYPVCSEDFRMPGVGEEAGAIAEALGRMGAKGVAITRGGKAVLGWERGRGFEVEAPRVEVVDTLGAGDVFHGAFCYRMSCGASGFEQALEFAARVASASCEHEGARAWMSEWRG